MDNCWRENKNQFVLVFLAVLVQLNIFKKVKVNFLMVGHTHEDVDQLFSRIRQRIFNKMLGFSLLSLPFLELLEAIARSSSPTTCVQLITSMFNIREWVEPARVELHNISNAHCFVIKRSTGPNCEVVLKYKQWSRDNEWLPPGSGIPVLKPNVTPQGLPTFCEPSPDKVDLERLKREIPKFYESRKFDESHKQWWDDFLNNRHGYYSRPGQHLAEWPLPNIIEKKNQQQESESGDQEQEIGILGIPRPTNVPLEVEQHVSSQLDSIPEIYTGPYRPPVRSVTQVGSYENVEVGHLVAVNLQNYKPPNIAEVVARTDKEFTVKWFKGGYRKEWKPDNRWPECSIPQQSVILYGFSLENNRFTADTAKFLRRAYKDVAN
ncbi:uncharacterized protein LOC114576108 [Exaiptasia diaphana]|uniref:DUF7869 domain-containing protein n=1 Tax=Exaiptasia diaphana TaxID=2652724 RepID=A0A913YTY7_EXADI|nr:uncharacterized protein LOC114576108 [Exaiptasia diaphana]